VKKIEIREKNFAKFKILKLKKFHKKEKYDFFKKLNF